MHPWLQALPSGAGFAFAALGFAFTQRGSAVLGFAFQGFKSCRSVSGIYIGSGTARHGDRLCLVALGFALGFKSCRSVPDIYRGETERHGTGSWDVWQGDVDKCVL